MNAASEVVGFIANDGRFFSLRIIEEHVFLAEQQQGHRSSDESSQLTLRLLCVRHSTRIE